MSEITEEQIESWADRDTRIKQLGLALDIERDLLTPVIQVLLDEIARDEKDAFEELALVKPTDTHAIVSAQAKVYMARLAASTIGGILKRGQLAAESLKDQGQLDA